MDVAARSIQNEPAAPPLRPRVGVAGEDGRDAALRRHLPLVRDVAQAIAYRKPGHVEYDELVSWGMEGLLDAWHRYRPDKHASFRTYARFRVRGAILDALRDRDWLSRTARRKALLLERTRMRLEAALGRAPGEDEIARELQIDVRTLRAMTRDTDVATVSVEDLVPTGATAYDVGQHLPDHEADPLHAVLDRERAALVARALRRLPAKEHAALTLYYRSDLTMREVASELGLSESRVSQLHSQALARLRTLLDEDVAVAC